MCKGFIMLSRSFFENELWEAKRTYSDAEAWLDLIQLARFEDGERTVRIGKVEVVEKRGQVAISTRALAERWGRSIGSIQYLMKKLINHDMVSIDTKEGLSIISLTNYDKYNFVSKVKKQAKGKKESSGTKCVNVISDTDSNTLSNTGINTDINTDNELCNTCITDDANTLSNTHSNTLTNTDSNTHTNKDNKANNSETSSNEDEKKELKKRYFVSTKTSVEDRRNDLWEQLQPFVPVFGVELVSDFFAYWSAPDKTGKDRMVIDDKRIKVFRIWDRLNTWLVKSNGKYEHNQKLAENGIKRSENDGSIVHTDVQANTRYISRWDAARQRADETNGRIAEYIKRTLYPDADTVTDSARDSPAVREGGQLCSDVQHPNGV